MEQTKVRKIDDSTYYFTETAMGTDVYMYLLLGEEKALLIDTAYGFTDVPKAIKEITDLPLIVANTHAHFDHIHGNHMYSEVYLSQKDEELFRLHTDYAYCKTLFTQVAEANGIPETMMDSEELNLEGIVTAYPSVHKTFPEEMFFELGNRRVSIIETPGHTEGSVSFLDEKNGWLFSGDTDCKDGVLLNLDGSTSVQVFYETILKLFVLAAQERIKALYPSHQITPLGTDILGVYAEACENILNGKISEEELDKGVYQARGITISFLKNRIR